MFYIWGSFKSENSLVYSGVWKKVCDGVDFSFHGPEWCLLFVFWAS